MLISCPECNHDVSDKAAFCPQCGYPFQTSPKRHYQSTKRRRLPNGFGQITLLKNPNLRKPYRAMITVGKNEFGKPICKLLKPVAYFETYNEAYAALVEYNKDPNLSLKKTTLEEVYTMWSEAAFEEYPNRVSTYQRIWKHLKHLGTMKFSDIRTIHIKETMERDNPTQSVCREIKGLWNKLFNYAMQYDYADKNYAEVFTMPKSKVYKPSESAHNSFTDSDMQKLEESNLVFAKTMLFQCYTGFRPKEVCELLKKNVDLDNFFIVGGMKTDAGRDRIVPIHPKIRDIVKEAYENSDTEYLFTHNNKRYTYYKYNEEFNKCIAYLNINMTHTPHDCRKQFVTMAKRANIDEYAIKRIVGHVITDLTENVYTDRDKEWLMNEVCKIK